MCRGRRQRTCPVGRDPCVPPQHTHYSRRGTRAPPYRVRRSYRADRVVRPYFLSFRASPRREASALGVQTGVGIRIPARRCRADGTSRTPSPTKNAGCRGAAALTGRRGRRPLRKMRVAAAVTAGHTGSALQGAAVIQGGQSRPPLYSAKRDGCRRLFLFSYTAAPRR